MTYKKDEFYNDSQGIICFVSVTIARVGAVRSSFILQAYDLASTQQPPSC
jgi:hypothetical protein